MNKVKQKSRRIINNEENRKIRKFFLREFFFKGGKIKRFLRNILPRWGEDVLALSNTPSDYNNGYNKWIDYRELCRFMKCIRLRSSIYRRLALMSGEHFPGFGYRYIEEVSSIVRQVRDTQSIRELKKIYRNVDKDFKKWSKNDQEYKKY